MDSNIKVQTNNNSSKFCLIAFSSNGANIEYKYEFENICKSRRIIKSFKKIIFVRDLSRHFYIDGINNELNDIFKITNRLIELTKGMTVRTIGYSAGGYMALLSALLMNNVDRVIAPGAVLNLLEWHGSYNDYNFSDFDVVKDATLDKKKYFNLLPFMHSIEAEIFAFYAALSESDKRIINNFSNEKKGNIHIILYNTTKHGSYCKPLDYKYLLTYKTEKLCKIVSKNETKVVSPSRFSLYLQRWFYVGNIIAKIVSKFGRKVCKLFK